MNSVTATRADLDPTLRPRLPGEVFPTPRAGAGNRFQAHDEVVSVTRSASLLAALHSRLDEANAVAQAERRTNRNGDMSNSDSERLHKLYPPYPAAYQERAAYLDRLAGLGKLNESLRPSALPGVDTQEQSERLAQAVAAKLAAAPQFSLSRQSAQILRTNLEGGA